MEQEKLKEKIDSNESINEKDMAKGMEDMMGMLTGMFEGLENQEASKIYFEKTHEDAVLPKYATEGSSGFDWVTPESFTLEAGSRKLVQTGLKVLSIPKSLEIQVRPRSGLAIKKGVTVLNSPGTIDSDYRGEVGIILHNTSNENINFKKGDRIAQGIINSIIQLDCEFGTKEDFEKTKRGEGGFGSTDEK